MRAILVERPCDWCSIPYLPSRTTQRFHSHECGKKAWEAANRVLLTARQKARRDANPELAKQREAAWRAANREKSRIKARQYRLENPEKIKKWAADWRRANLEKLRHKNAMWAASRSATYRVFFTKAQFDARMAYFGDACWMCGGPFESIDHVKPTSKGGGHLLANMRPACASCNSRKHDLWQGPAWTRTLRKILAAVAVLLIPLSASAQTCAPELYYFEGRCLTEAEWTAWPPMPPAPLPVPTPPTPVYRGMGNGNVEQWRTMVAYYWGKHGATDRMLRILRCESGGNPNAWNRSTDVRGLFQVRYPLWSKLWPGNYYDPWTNAAIAYQIWLTQGYRAWACKG